MDNNVYSDELQHYGIMGMRWGIRRYQNKDGTLTNRGKKRYNKEVEKLRKETAKVKEAEKIAVNRKKTQTKLDKLEAKKQELEARKKALKEGKTADEDNTPKGTPEQRRERALKSTNPKEIYENRDVLTYNELSERVNRLDLEARLQNKIPVERQKTGMDYVDSAKNAIDKAAGLFRSVDNAYSAVANSAIGKTLAKQLGLEVPKEKHDLNAFYKNIATKTNQQVADEAKRVKNEKTIRDAVEAAGNTKMKDIKNNTINMDDIKSYIDDAVEDAVSNKNDDK